MVTAIPVFFDVRMVADAQSYSPSAGKPQAVVESWKSLGFPLAFPKFEPATFEHLCQAHAASHVRGVLSGRIPNGFDNTLPDVARALPWTSGSMLAAVREAVRNGKVAVAPVSGFHHAKYAECGGFCTFNGLIVAARAVQQEGLANNVGILDFDMHYGNGTDDILRRLQPDGIAHYTAGRTYMFEHQAAEFIAGIRACVECFSDCDVLLYQAGADPHIDDPLGGWLTNAQLAERDRLVFQTCADIGLPVAWNLAGGYQTPLRKVLDIHDATMRECAAVFLATEEA